MYTPLHSIIRRWVEFAMIHCTQLQNPSTLITKVSRTDAKRPRSRSQFGRDH